MVRAREIGALGVLTMLAIAATSVEAQEGAKGLDEAWVKGANANDVEAVVGLYADDAILYPPDGPKVEGKAAIRAYYAAWLGANTVSDAKILESHSKNSGDLSTSWGEVSLTTKPKAGGEPTTFKVRATSVAARRGGKWLYITDHASAPLPPPPAMTPAAR